MFREVYLGESIFWERGTYSTGGLSGYRTIGEMRAAINRMHSATREREAEERARKLANGAIRCERRGDMVTVHLPDGPREMTIRAFRQSVFDIEETHGRETVFAE